MDEVSEREEELRGLIDRLLYIGTELSSQRELGVLLELIVEEMRGLTGADGGTLFLLNDEREQLDWAVVLNETLGIKLGGRHGGALDEQVFRPLSLCDEGAARNVAVHVARGAEAVCVEDVYQAGDSFDFTGPRRFDEQTGYRTRSMLVVPLTHFDGGVVGVLQLINARDVGGQVVGFDERARRVAMAVASQAAVAVKNAQLFRELELQFEAFIRAIATAIDEKSRYTAGHVRRVVTLSMKIAQALHESEEGEFAQVSYSDDELKAIKVAAWMHDVGKIATPEYVVDKATKLEALYDRFGALRERWEVLRMQARVRMLEATLEAPERREEHEARYRAELVELDEALGFIERCNQGAEWMSDEALARLEALASRRYVVAGESRPWLDEDELKNLSIRRGTLTWEQIEIIRSHAQIGFRMLSQLPFSRHLARVPEIAAGHHEKLNGMGYPRGLKGDELSREARILAIADIFEALTAKDRPYKQPTKLSQVRRILDAMVKDGDLDGELVRFAMRAGVFDAYAEEEISEEQRDLVFREVAS